MKIKKAESICIKSTDVKIDRTPLKTTSVEHILRAVISKKIEASSLKREQVFIEFVEEGRAHPFLLMLHIAFCEHKAVSITPDNIWLLVCQGFAEHINLYAEDLRGSIVDFEEKQTIQIRQDDFVKGETNPWEEIFPAFSEKISSFLKTDLHANIALNFSTSTIKETTAFEIAFMDAMSSYFEYEFLSMCGIPEIHLEGSSDDYRKMLGALDHLRQYKLDWWIDKMYPLIENIIKSIDGDIDTQFWRSIYKVNNESGGPYVTGWITSFFPYLRMEYQEEDKSVWALGKKQAAKFFGLSGNLSKEDDEMIASIIASGVQKEQVIKVMSSSKYMGFVNSTVIIKNPILAENSDTDIKLNAYPQGISRADFKWQYLDENFDMTLLSGFMGVTEDLDTHILASEINWIICEK